MPDEKLCWIYLYSNNMNCSRRLDNDHKKSGLQEVFTGTDYQPLADEIATLSYKSTPAGENI